MKIGGAMKKTRRCFSLPRIASLALAAILLLAACSTTPVASPTPMPAISFSPTPVVSVQAVTAAPTQSPAAETPAQTETQTPTATATPTASASPTPSPTRTPKPTPSSTLPPLRVTYGEAKLLDQPKKGQLCIGIAPTVLGVKRKYFVPDEDSQGVMLSMLLQVTEAHAVNHPVYEDLLGITMWYLGEEWLLAQDGSLFRQTGQGHSRIQLQEDLKGYLLPLLKQECGIAQIDPAEIKDLVRAELVYYEGGKETARQTVTDPEKLRHLESRLSVSNRTTPSSCPFNEGMLLLARGDGTTITLRLASDDCTIYFADGIYFDYGDSTEAGGSNRDVLGLFEEIPWVKNRP